MEILFAFVKLLQIAPGNSKSRKDLIVRRYVRLIRFWMDLRPRVAPTCVRTQTGTYAILRPRNNE